MGLITKSTKQGGTTSFQDGQRLPAADLNSDSDTVFNLVNGNIDNTNIKAGAAVAYSKLALTNSIVNADINSAAAIAYSKLALTASIVNADIGGSAAIAYSKLSLANSITSADIASPGINLSKIDAAFSMDSGIINGFFDWWQRQPAASSVSVTNNTDTYIADRWAVEPIGANCTVSRVTTNLHSSAVSDVGIELIGNASMTSIELTQRIGRSAVRRLGALLANQNVTFGAKIKHSGTTGTITPTLIVRSTSNTGDDTTNTKFANANMTQRVSQAFTGLTNGQESSLTHTFDLGAMTDGENGIEVTLSFAAMSATTQKITVTDVYLIRGASAPTALVRPNDLDEFNRCIFYYQKTFAYGTAAAQASGTFVDAIWIQADTITGSTVTTWQHAPLRGVPTLTTYNPTQSASSWRNEGDTGNSTEVVVAGSKVTKLRTTTGTQGINYAIHAAADAEWYD